MDDVTRGLIGRRVCGSIELGFGVLTVIGAIYSANIISILSGVFIISTGVLGIASTQKGRVIAYLVTGIICSLFLLLSIILSAVAIVAINDVYGLDNTLRAILIVSVVIVGLALIVAVLGVVFACLPLCGNSEHTSPNTVGPASYNNGNIAFTATMQGPSTNNYGNAAYPVTMQGPPAYNHGNTADPIPMQKPPAYNHGNTADPDIMQEPPLQNDDNTAGPATKQEPV